MVDNKIIKSIKTDFFALRNGEIADRLRKAGSPYKIIFGLQIPQLNGIASKFEPSAELAETLWDNRSTRESRLLATMVYPVEEFTVDMAEKWSSEADTVELADMLCFRLVRYIEGAEALVEKKIESDKEADRYFALRLAMNLLVMGKLKDVGAVYSMAQRAYSSAAAKTVAAQIIEEIDFINEK